MHSVIAIGLIAVLTMHFSLTLAYLTPPNPSILTLRPVIDRYMEPFFAQNWSLFAPNPIVDTRFLLVACRVEDQSGGLHQTAWSNITTPLREARSRYRVGPSAMLERAQMGPLHRIFPPDDPLLQRLMERKEPALLPAIAEYDDSRRRLIAEGLSQARRVASVECDRLNGVGRTREVGMRLVIIKSPPFSLREAPMDPADAQYIELPWGPYAHVSIY